MVRVTFTHLPPLLSIRVLQASPASQGGTSLSWGDRAGALPNPTGVRTVASAPPLLCGISSPRPPSRDEPEIPEQASTQRSLGPNDSHVGQLSYMLTDAAYTPPARGGFLPPGMVDFFLEKNNLFVCQIFRLGKIRLPITNLSPLDHKEVTEPAYRDICGGRAEKGRGWRGGGPREAIKPGRLDALRLVEESGILAQARLLAVCLGGQWAIKKRGGERTR